MAGKKQHLLLLVMMYWHFYIPVDGHLTNLPSMRVSCDELKTPAPDDEDPYIAHIGSTFIPMPVRGLTEQQAIQQSVLSPSPP